MGSKHSSLGSCELWGPRVPRDLRGAGFGCADGSPIASVGGLPEQSGDHHAFRHEGRHSSGERARI